MSRPSDWSPIGRTHDPVPGEPGVVMTTGRLYIGTADAILRAAENLTTALAPGFGQAEAIDAIRDQAEDVARRIVRAETRYRGVGDAMVAYAPVLTDAQARSVAALNKAIEAQGHREHADRMAEHYQQRLDDPSTPPANVAYVRDRLQHWRLESGGAQLSMAGAEQDLHDAVVDRDLAAETALEAIQLVENSGDLNDTRWDNFTQWVDEHKEILDTVGTVLGVVAAVAGIVLMFIPGINIVVGVILAAIVVANIAYQALNAAAQVSTGNMSLAEGIVNVGLAALNVVGAGAALKVAATATKSTVATSLMRSYAGSGISGMSRARAVAEVERLGVVASGSRATPLAVKVAAQAIGLDTRAASAVHAMASIQLLSGAQATGAMRPLLLASGFTVALGTATTLAEDPLADALEPHVPEFSWRLGGDW